MVAEQTISMLARAIASEDRPLTPAAAQEVLQWHLSDEDNRRIDELLTRSKNGEMTSAEMEEFRERCAAVDMLSLLHLRAHDIIGDSPSGA